MGERTTFVELDLHKATIAVAIALGGLREAAEFLRTIENTPQAIAKLLAKLRRKHKHLSFCYEAGPCGYGVHRQLTEAGEACSVVAPALIPRRAADRVKTDRRVAISLAQLHRAGELRAIWVPDAAHEAMRDLVRARLVAVQSVRRARRQLSGFLLRHGCIYDGKTAWTRTHRRWLSSLRFAHPAQQIVAQDYTAAISDAEQRCDALNEQIRLLLPAWSTAPVVHALQALRGVALVVAATLVAELGDPRPVQKSSPADGPSRPCSIGTFERRHGAAGRHHQDRRCGGTARDDGGGLDLPAAGAGQPGAAGPKRCVDKTVRDIAWKAQTRLCVRCRRLAAAGKPTQTVVTAIARELVGFAWAIARHVQPAST
jgi:transposase